MQILYGGTFNPPTIAHLAILKYLVNKYPDANIVVLPTNSFYKAKEVVAYHHRRKMVELMVKELPREVEISDFELTLDRYKGTYFTLEHFNHPYFVIGADQLIAFDTWVEYPAVVARNKFIVFPRDNINVKEQIKKNDILNKYQENFVVIEDFQELDVSSSMFREHESIGVVLDTVLEYIKEHNLYEVN